MKEIGFIGALTKQEHLPLPLLYYSTANAVMLSEAVCALLNADGGWVIVGVARNGECIGTTSKLAVDVQKSVVAGINPLPLVYVQTELMEGKTVVLITVPKGSLPPYTYNGGYYIMQRDEVVRPSSDQTAMLLRDSKDVRTTWEADDCIMADEYCLDENLMQKVFVAGTENGRLRQSDSGLTGVLSELKLMTEMNVANGAVALFARDTRRLLPQCRVRVQVMFGGKTANNYDDTQVIEGNIFSCLERVIAYFEERLPMISRFSVSKSHRDDMLLYPIDVVDEAVCNALIHRDYTDRMDEVTIFIFRDRMEITNTGEMPSEIMISKNKFRQHGSVLRNPLMAEMFYIAGEMEKTGRGLQLISGKMKELGARLPEWRCENGKTVLTIYKSTVKRTVPERAKMFLMNHRKGDAFSKRDYLSSFDNLISETTAKNDLQAMVNEGLLEVSGRGPSTRYTIL